VTDSMGAGGGQPPGAGLNFVTDMQLGQQIQDEANQAAANTAASDPEDPGTGGIDPRTVQAKMRQAQATAAAAIGAGYEFSPGQIEKNIADAQNLKLAYQQAQSKIQTIIGVIPPAQDPMSVWHAQELSQRGKQLMNRNRSQISFLNSWIQSLQNAKTAYMNQEHVTEAEWKRMASGLTT
jgi:hypothetical protein